MDTMSAFFKCQAARAAGSKVKVFDWGKAAELIAASKPDVIVSAGLCGDWEYTGGVIYSDGKIVPEDDTYVYLASNWATPEIDIDGVVSECWRYSEDTPGWNAKTYWPASALEILAKTDGRR